MEQVAVAIITGIVAIVVALITARRRNNKDSEESIPEEKRLINALTETVDIQSAQIEALKSIATDQTLELRNKDNEIHELTQRVSNLEKLTISQALIIEELKKGRPAPKARARQSEGGEAETHD